MNLQRPILNNRGSARVRALRPHDQRNACQGMSLYRSSTETITGAFMFVEHGCPFSFV